MRYTPKNNGVTAPPPLRLLDQVRDRLRVRRYSLRTEQAYVSWIRRFILAGGKRHPAQMGQAEVEAFLTRLATDGRVSAGTQNQRWLRCCFFTAKCCASSCRGWKTWYAPSGPGGFR